MKTLKSLTFADVQGVVRTAHTKSDASRIIDTQGRFEQWKTEFVTEFGDSPVEIVDNGIWGVRLVVADMEASRNAFIAAKSEVCYG